MNEQGSGIIAWIRQNSMMILVVVVGLVLGIVFLGKRDTGGGSTASGGTQADLSGLATDASGRPIVYRDTANTSINISKVEGSYNFNEPTTPEENPIEQVIIRPRYANTTVTGYDKNHPEGIPVRATPGGQQVGVVAFGSLVNLTGAPTTGGSNLPGTQAGSGSNVWFPVAGGYVSAYDLTGVYSQ